MSNSIAPPIGSIGKDIISVLEHPKNPEASTCYGVQRVFYYEPQKISSTHDIATLDLDMTFQVDVLDLLRASEPALSAIWMTPDEDEAWKNL